MVKSCCAVGCTNRYSKGCGLRFYRFPSDVDRHSKWLVAMKRENWKPNQHSWVCSAHFVSGNKSDDPLSPSGPFVSAEHLDLLGGMLENLLCTEEDVMSPLQ